MTKDVPLRTNPADKTSVVEGSDIPEEVFDNGVFEKWVVSLSDYLGVVQERLFSSGLRYESHLQFLRLTSFCGRVLGAKPKEKDIDSYLEAYFGERLSHSDREAVVQNALFSNKKKEGAGPWAALASFWSNLIDDKSSELPVEELQHGELEEARSIAALLLKSTEELDGVLSGLDGGYIKPAPGGGECAVVLVRVRLNLNRQTSSSWLDLLRDGPSVLPTGRNIHSLDPYRMPSQSAWIRGKKAAEEIIRQHKASNNGSFPETVAGTSYLLRVSLT